MGLPLTLTFFVCVTLGLLWPILTFPHHILLMNLLFLYFRTSLSLSASSKPIYLFYGLVIHYSYHLGLIFFLFFYQFFSTCVAGLLLSIWLPKIIVNNIQSKPTLDRPKKKKIKNKNSLSTHKPKKKKKKDLKWAKIVWNRKKIRICTKAFFFFLLSQY